jgi:carboxyl-terminal processing protease
VDFEAAMSNDPDYRSSSRDVEKHLLELTNENIDGLIFDLRNNGGGSLQEVNEMTGLFIKTGPVVQIRDSRNQITRLGDLDPKLIYSGPLAVVVNRLSASASEIFAGAVQDYGRGIIVGSQTFGKGTVQSMEGLNSGRVKYTEAKYYRINGDSTQNRGVIPDIIFPSFLDHDEIGESSLPQTMAWDQIQSADYFRIASLDSIVDSLITEHKKRIAEDPDFKYLSERADLLKENRKKSTISLNEIERREERESMKERLLDMENRRRQALGLELYKDYAEMESAEKEKEKEEETDFQQDSMLRETGEILTDWLFELRPEK